MNSMPMTATAAVPIPAQIAYAVPIDIVLRVWASSEKASRYPATVMSEGHNRVNPSLYFMAVVPATSAAMAAASSPYPMCTSVRIAAARDPGSGEHLGRYRGPSSTCQFMID